MHGLLWEKHLWTLFYYTFLYLGQNYQDGKYFGERAVELIVEGDSSQCPTKLSELDADLGEILHL